MLGVGPIVVATAILASHSTFAGASDPCAAIAGQTYVVPADALACLNSFPFNETLRQNVLTVVSRVFDFYTFEDYYLNSPPPFQESTVDIRAEISRINSTTYATDYEFNRDLYDFVNCLNDGHTLWLPDCYKSWQNMLPAPIVSLEENGEQGIYIIPDSKDLISLLGSEYTDYFKSINFDWERLAGAKVLSIEGQDPYDYVDYIARTVSGNYLDHGVRVNSVFSSYRISSDSFSQRLGDLAGPLFPDLHNLTFSLITVNSTSPENVTVPYLVSFSGNDFTDAESYWANNCAANNETNGVDYRSSGALNKLDAPRRRLARGVLTDKSPVSAVGLPNQFQPTLPQVNGSTGVIKSYILPDNQTGVMFIGSFEGDYDQFQTDTESAINAFKEADVDRVLIDLTNNGGGYVCLGIFLHSYLAGSGFSDGYGGFQSTSRANPLAQKILAAEIAQGLNNTYSYYTPDNWAFLNGTDMPLDYNYNDPSSPLVVNGESEPESQRFEDVCTPYVVDLPEEPPFDLSKVAIVGNGNCASTCSMFSTVMYERHNTTIAIFGGKPGEAIEYKGMAGNQVLEWADIDSEIKTAGLKDDPLAPPDLLVSADFRHNWRIAWSYLNESVPIAYQSEHPQLRFAYTTDTYINPQNLWSFAASQIFG